MLYLTRSAGMLAALALSMARRRRGLALGSPPPERAATVISRMMRVQILPRFSSWRPLRCWILAHLLCPAMVFLGSRSVLENNPALYFSIRTTPPSHG